MMNLFRTIRGKKTKKINAMLRINITPTGSTKLTSADFKNYKLPIPSKGIKEKKRATALIFDNEYEAFGDLNVVG